MGVFRPICCIDIGCYACSRRLKKPSSIHQAGHGDLIEELLLVVIVKFLNHTVSYSLGHWNKPQLNSEIQTQSDKGTHPARISTTPVVG
jgi:hypothetical protein